MEFNFTGSSRPQRTINVGGYAHPSSVADLAASARRARAERQQEKKRAWAASRIQARYRAHATATRTQQAWAAEFDRDADMPGDMVTWTRKLLFSGSRPTEAHAHRLAVWARQAAGEYEISDRAAWATLLRMAARDAIHVLTAAPVPWDDAWSLVQFLQTLLTGPQQDPPAAAVAHAALTWGLHRAMRQALALCPDGAGEAHTAIATVMLVPLEMAGNDATGRALFWHTLTRDVLTMPQWHTYMPTDVKNTFVMGMPWSELEEALQVHAAARPCPLENPDILANIVALTAPQVPQMKGRMLASYLSVMALLQNALPRVVFESVSAATRADLAVLVADATLRDLFAAAARSAASSRPALCAHLLALFELWPSPVVDKVLQSLLYGYDGKGQLLTAQPGSIARELWRGWLRSGGLVRALNAMGSDDSASRASDIREILTRSDLSADWAMLVVLGRVYGRCLLTLGDEEFYPPSMLTSEQPQRNPLTLDELVTLSGMLRTLVFHLWWSDAAVAMLDHCLPSTRLSVSHLRTQLTRLLQQLHSRDARQAFTPQGHWHMLSERDLPSFIQAVVLDERTRAAAHDDDTLHTGTMSRISQRSRALMTPRLDVLNEIPFVIPFEVRVEIFRQFVRNDAERLGLTRDLWGFGARHRATIRRSHVAEDGMAQLNGLGSRLKEPLEIVFIDQWGQPEAGIDGGGVFKEFLTSMVRTVFDTDRGLWRSNEREELYPTPHLYAQAEEQLVWYTFLGRIIGKALYEGILVNVNFAAFFLSKWLGPQGYIDDFASLASLDSELYRGLLALKHYNGDVEADFALNFTVTDDELGERRTSELIPNGANVMVTRENRLAYLYQMTRYRLSTQIEAQCRAFCGGLSDMIDPTWLRLFHREELRVLVSGTDAPVDIGDLRRHTVYGGYHEKDLAVQYFWEALEALDATSRRAFLRFVTSSPNPPLLGFGELRPQFAIRHAGDDASRLPTASTCVNLLKLPAYTSKEQCLAKLQYAIHANAGFDLS